MKYVGLFIIKHAGGGRPPRSLFLYHVRHCASSRLHDPRSSVSLPPWKMAQQISTNIIPPLRQTMHALHARANSDLQLSCLPL
jgi:hypothetical protein